MKGKAESFQELRDFCETIPLVDCHDHSDVCGPRYTDAILTVKSGYFNSDLLSASSDRDIRTLEDTSLSFMRFKASRVSSSSP